MKKLFCSLTLIMVIMLLSSCGTPDLPEGYDSDEVINAAKATIEVINTRDYEEIHALIREDLQPAITVNDLEEAWDPILEDAGPFVDFDDIALASKRGEKDDVYAMTVVKCEYENDDLIYTFYFDENMDLCGLWMK